MDPYTSPAPQPKPKSKPTMSNSYCAPKDPNPQTPLFQMRQSTISRNSQLSPNSPKLQYRYERVDNIFRLVDVRSNQNVSHSDLSLQAIDKAIKQLTQRVITLQLQQAKTHSLTDKVEEVRAMVANVVGLSQLVEDRDQEIADTRGRIEEMEEQGFAHHVRLEKMELMLGQVALGKIPEIQRQVQKLAEDIRQQLRSWALQLPIIPFKLGSPQSLSSTLLPPSPATSTESEQRPRSRGLHIKYRQSYQTKSGIYSINEKLYHIDSQGILLDDSGYIILDHQNKPVQLNHTHIQKLKQFNVIR